MVESIFIAFSAVLLAVVFFTAGFAKMKSIDTLEGVVQNFRILPASLSRPFALLLPPTEIVVAASLIVPATRTVGAAVAAFLLLIFTIAIAINLARGRREIDCGCFSSHLKQNLNGWLLGRNLMLTGLAVGLALVNAMAPGAAWPPIVAWLLGAVAAGLTIFVYLTITTLATTAEAAAQRRAAAAGNF